MNFISILFLIFGVAVQASAKDTLSIPEFNGPYHIWGWSYLSPNESRVGQGLPLLREVPEGVLISTGSERANFAGIMAKNASHVLVIDTDEDIKKFHKTNWFLLAASKGDQKKYLHLRFRASYEEWTAAAKSLAPNNIYLTGSSLEHFNFWQSMVRDNPDFLGMDRDFSNVRRVGNGYSGSMQNAYWTLYEFVSRAEAPEKVKEKLPSMTHKEKIEFLLASKKPDMTKTSYSDLADRVMAGENVILNDGHIGLANYLYSEAGFARLYKMVSEERMLYVGGNFFNEERMHEIVTAIQSRGLQLAGIDLSNIWDHNYQITAEQFAKLMDQLSPISTDRSMMIFTRVASHTAGYRAFRFKKLASDHNKLLALGKVIKKMIYLEDRDFKEGQKPDYINHPGLNPLSGLEPETLADIQVFVDLKSKTFSFGDGFIDFDVGYLDGSYGMPCENVLTGNVLNK